MWRWGWLAAGRHDKQVSLSLVTSVVLKPASRLSNGFVRFEVSTEAHSRLRRWAGWLARWSPDLDEHAVMFTRKQQPVFEVLCADVREALADR